MDIRMNKQTKMKTKMPFKKVIRKHWMLLLMLLPAVGVCNYFFLCSYDRAGDGL